MRDLLKARLRSVFEEILDELIGRLTNGVIANCIECGAPTDHFHHPIPKVLGGSSTIPVCHACHGKIHNLDFENHGSLIKAGIDRARTGKNRLLTKDEIAEIRSAIDRGIPSRAIKKLFRCGDSTITRIRRGEI